MILIKRGEEYVNCSYILFILGFRIESIVFPIRTNASPVKAINIPGGINHHHSPLDAAAAI
jgi:hypothetical protein